MTKNAFTLAEFLITLSIIGIVSAITLPTLIQKYEERSWNTSATNFERKFGEALKIMHTQSSLEGFSSTKEFLNDLSNYYKIVKICDKPEECFTENFKLKSGETFKSSNITTSEKLGHEPYQSEALGVLFGDGTSGIIAYNKKFTAVPDSPVVKFSGDKNNISISTGALTILYDINGIAKPNTNNKDIRGINTILGSTNGCNQIGNYCITILGTDYSPLPCRLGLNSEYCGQYPSNSTQDNWAGAKKACEDIGLRLTNYSELLDLYALGTVEEGIVPTSGVYWAFDEYDTRARALEMDIGRSRILDKSSKFGAICVN